MTDRLRVALGTCLVNAFLHISLHSWVSGEIVVNELFGFCPTDTQPFGQAKGRDAVDDTEVGRFGATAFLATHLFNFLMEYLGCCGRMDVVPETEVLNQSFVAAQMCHDAQLNLRIVGREELLTRGWHKGFANLLAVG